jgi:hypothetical protein
VLRKVGVITVSYQILFNVSQTHALLCSYGQFILATLPPLSACEKDVEVDAFLFSGRHSKDGSGEKAGASQTSKMSSTPASGEAPSGGSFSSNASYSPVSISPRVIALRNKCLEILHTLLYNSNKNTIHLG